MSKKLKKKLKRIIIALSAFLLLMLADKVILPLAFDKNLATVIDGKYGWTLAFGLFLGVYVYIGYDVLRKAAVNIAHGQVFDENFLMVIATLGAFALAICRGFTGQEVEGFDEACAVLLFYQVGEWFQSYAVGKSRKDIASLMDVRPDYANLVTADGVTKVDPSSVNVGDLIVVKPGEKIPLDGEIVEGRTSLDAKALTGESAPIDAHEGETVISGCVNISGTVKVRVDKAFHDSTVAKILDLVENASSQKSKTENFITKFAKYYTPIVVGVAVLLAIIPGIITKDFATWVYRALSFLVVSCPCALVISIPLGFFAGIGGASKKGILIKGSSYLEKFAATNVFVFDKTGTLTKGNFTVSNVFPAENREEILRLASVAEKGSNHPIAKSITEAYGKDIPDGYTVEEISGHGIIARGECEIACGNAKLMRREGIEFEETNEIGTVVYVAKNKKFVGSILIADEIKADAKETIKALNEGGAKTIMLTGDNEKIAGGVAEKLGLGDYKASLLPQDKVAETEKLINNKKSNEVVCFVGDGINDAPVLMRSDIGVAMGGVGSDAAIEAADIVLMNDNLSGIIAAKHISAKTMRIVKQNIWLALAVKIGILVLAACGIANMWLAVFGDVGVAVLAILNSMRARY